MKNIASSQHTLSKVKDTINVSTKDLTDPGDNMNNLNENLKTYNDMIEILSAIEYLKKIPSELEDSISDKNYSKAQSLLQAVNSKAQTYRLWDLPAVSNLENYFQLQSQQLFEILIEEIHNIIYSKKLFNTFNSTNEVFKNSEKSDYSNIEKYLMNAIDVDILETASINHSNVEGFLSNLMSSSTNNNGNYVKSGLENDNDVVDLVALDDTNPFNQLLHLFTIVYRLEKLPTAIEIIIQRNANEINQMINRIVEDTKLRHPKIIRYLNSSLKSKDISKGLGIDESMNDDNFKTIIVRDLFWNFFRKLLFLLQCVRVIHEIIRSLQSESFESAHLNTPTTDVTGDDSLTLTKLWHSLRFEVKNFVTSYISNNDLSLGSKLTNSNTNSVKNDNAMITKQDNSLFQFYKVDYDEDHSNQLKLVLQDLFPGFINSNDMAKIDSPYIEDAKFLKQSRIIPANIFNMRNILEPFLVFIEGTKLIMNENDRDEPVLFFNSFMNNDFLPILEESFISIYIDEVEELNPYELYDDNDKPLLTGHQDSDDLKIFKFIVEFKRLFSDICFILNTSLQFRKEFSSILFKILNKFHDKVEEFSQELLNELSNYFEPNREIIKALRNPSLHISPQSLEHVNKGDLKKLNVVLNFKVLNNSLQFLLEWFENNLIKKIDLNKTDLNLSTIEKLRKNWSFFEITNLKTNNLHENELDLKHSIKVILNDELTENYNGIVQDYKNIKKLVENVLVRYEELSRVHE